MLGTVETRGGLVSFSIYGRTDRQRKAIAYGSGSEGVRARERKERG